MEDAASIGSGRILRDIGQRPQYPWVLVHLVRVSRPVAMVLLAVPFVIQEAAPPLTNTNPYMIGRKKISFF